MLINKHIDGPALIKTFQETNGALRGIGFTLVASIVACRGYTMFFTGKDVKQAVADKTLWTALMSHGSRSKFYQVRKPGYAVSNLMAEGGEASALATLFRNAKSNDDVIAGIKAHMTTVLQCETVEDIYAKVIGKRLVDPSKPAQEKATTASVANIALRLETEPKDRSAVLSRITPKMPEADVADLISELFGRIVTLSTAQLLSEQASKHVASLSADKEHAQGEAVRKRSEGKRNRKADRPEPVAKVA